MVQACYPFMTKGIVEYSRRDFFAPSHFLTRHLYKSSHSLRIPLSICDEFNSIWVISVTLDACIKYPPSFLLFFCSQINFRLNPLKVGQFLLFAAFSYCISASCSVNVAVCLTVKSLNNGPLLVHRIGGNVRDDGGHVELWENERIFSKILSCFNLIWFVTNTVTLFFQKKDVNQNTCF